MPLESLVAAAGRMDHWDRGRTLASAPASLRKYYGLSLAVSLGMAGLLILAALAWRHLSEKNRGRVWQAGSAVACACAVLLYLTKMQYEGEWAPIAVLMAHPGSLPLYGHRLLFVWLAMSFRAVVPALAPLTCYYASQAVAALVAVYAVGRWSAAITGESLSWLGQVLSVVLISTCFSYRDFYDIGIVFFFACGLLAIYRRKYGWFVLVVVAGTLNHENALLLIPAAAFLIYDKEPRRVWVPVIAAALLGHFLVRAGLQAAIPFEHHVSWGVWANMTKPFLLPEMKNSVLALGGWYALGLMSWSGCDARLRRLTVLFPLLFGVTLLFGQFQEARQFAAFVPVLVALLLSNTRRSLALEARGPRPVARGAGRLEMPTCAS
jgi:hypothetical protein